MKKLFSILVIIMLICGCSTSSFKTIMTNEALDLLNKGAILIDVRTEEEYEREHIPDAINIPLGSINDINIDKDKQIIIYCQTGIRSKEAALELIKLGYKDIYNLDGGLLNWGGNLINSN